MIERSLWPRLMALSVGKPWPPGGEPETRRFIETVINNDLFPLLFDDRELPPIVREVSDQYAALALLHQQRSKTFEALFSDLAAALEGERFAVLKGMDYAYRLYARPHHRPFRDIDILVPRSRMIEISRRLVAAGWIETQPSTAIARLESNQERGFRREGINVELHNRFVKKPSH